MRLSRFQFSSPAMILALSFAAVLTMVGPTRASTCPALPPVSAMTLTFEDTFKAPMLDRTKWTAVAQGGARAINNEQQAYVPDGVIMVPGVGLRLQANRTPFATQSYTSGEIISRGHFAQTYGYFEMKAKLPNGNGLWPAFWLLPNNGAWPPEIDVMEYIYAPFGKHGLLNPSYYSRGLFWPPAATIWQPPNGSLYKSNSKVYLTDDYKNVAADPPVRGDFGKAWHTFGVAWYPDMVAFYSDGVRNFCWVEGPDTKGSVPSQPMFLLANLAIGAPGGWPGTVDASTVFPANMDIAYIRAYQFANMPAGKPDPVSIMHPMISPSPMNAAAPAGSATPIRAGDAVAIDADIVIGGEDLPGPVRSTVTIHDYDATRLIESLDFPEPARPAAGSTHHLAARYTLPADLAPGIYTVRICVFWNGDANEQCLASNHAPAISVVSATSAACGASDGAAFNKKPTRDLCKSGTASPVTAASRWSWTCADPNGVSARCSAAMR